MSADALETLGAEINALSSAIQNAGTASTFNMRPSINAVLAAALRVQIATHKVVANLDRRTTALEARLNASS